MTPGTWKPGFQARYPGSPCRPTSHSNSYPAASSAAFYWVRRWCPNLCSTNPPTTWISISILWLENLLRLRRLAGIHYPRCAASPAPATRVVDLDRGQLTPAGPGSLRGTSPPAPPDSRPSGATPCSTRAGAGRTRIRQGTRGPAHARRGHVRASKEMREERARARTAAALDRARTAEASRAEIAIEADSLCFPGPPAFPMVQDFNCKILRGENSYVGPNGCGNKNGCVMFHKVVEHQPRQQIQEIQNFRPGK